MALTFTRDLDPLTSSGLELDDPSRDFRGREIVDGDGNTVGTVVELLIDPGLRVPRLLVLETGGLLGMGKKQYLVPLEAVQEDSGQLRMQRHKDEITNEPEYHPADGEEEEELQYVQVYAAYGIRPDWEVEAAAPSATTVEPDVR